MKFIHPLFLFGLFFLIVPVLVHLFNFRKYKKVFFTNTKLLKSLISETRKISELKKKLIFISRLLAFFFIVLAFAQPYYNRSTIFQDNPVISIYIDNSESMGLFYNDQRLLDIAKQKALELVNNNKEKAQYQIISNNFSPSELQVIRYSEATSLIESLKLSPFSKNIDEILSKQVQCTKMYARHRTTFYVISDFQKYQCKPILDKESKIVFVPLEHVVKSNQYIDTAWINAPVVKLNQDVGVIIRYNKQKDEPSSETMCRLEVNGNMKQSKRLKWDAHSMMDTLYFKISEFGWNKVKISIFEEHMKFDNEYYLSFKVQDKPIVTIISDFANAHYIESALKLDEYFTIHKYQNQLLPEEEFKQSNLLILNQIQSFSSKYIEIIQKMQLAGKPTILFMPVNASIINYNDVFGKLGVDQIVSSESQKMFMKDVNVQEDLLHDVIDKPTIEQSMPYSERYYGLSGRSSLAKEPIINFRNGMPVLIKYNLSNQIPFYLFTSSIDIQYSDFVQKSLFAPMMFKLGNVSSQQIKSSYVIASNTTISYPLKHNNKDDFFELKGRNRSVIPPQQQVGFMIHCSLSDVIAQSGFYTLTNKEKTSSFEVALNYDRKESILEFLTPKELEERYSEHSISLINSNTSLAKRSEELSNGITYWKMAIWCSLFFILLEVVLILFGDQILSKIEKQ